MHSTGHALGDLVFTISSRTEQQGLGRVYRGTQNVKLVFHNMKVDLGWRTKLAATFSMPKGLLRRDMQRVGDEHKGKRRRDCLFEQEISFNQSKVR